MDHTTIVITTVITTLGAGGIVKLVQMWVNYKKESKKESSADGLAFRDSLKERVSELEEKVNILQKRIEEMIEMYSERILILSTENARLNIALENAHKEIERLLTNIEEADSGNK